MAKLSLKLRPKEGLQSYSDKFHDTEDISEILQHIKFWGRHVIEEYDLFINGKKYDWPPAARGKTRYPRGNREMLEEVKKHIEHCIGLDEAFYD